MDIAHYFDNPEELNKETLYELRNLIALYPFYQPARILLLKNLFLLHDATFDEELRRAAIYITNRRVLFNLVEAAHYQLRPEKSQEATLQSAKHRQKQILTEQYRLLIISSNKFQTLRRKPRMVTESLHPSMQLWIMLPI